MKYFSQLTVVLIRLSFGGRLRFAFQFSVVALEKKPKRAFSIVIDSYKYFIFDCKTYGFEFLAEGKTASVFVSAIVQFVLVDILSYWYFASIKSILKAFNTSNSSFLYPK